MSLILSGTDGLSDVDGTAATPAIRGTDANTGIFFGTDIIGFSEGGVEAARINADSQFVAAAGTAALPVITTTGDVNTGIFFPAADTIAFTEGGAEAMRIDSSGNVGIGTASPAVKLHVSGGTQRIQSTGSTSDAVLTLQNDVGTQAILGLISSGNSPANTFFIETNGGKTVSVTSAGLFQFNNGYGSAAVAYGCRAWVNFNGTGTVAIRGSGNVTSITDSGTGSYTVNFTTAMPDANYAVKGAASVGTRYAFVSIASTPTTSGVAILVYGDDGSLQDCAQVHVSIVR